MSARPAKASDRQRCTATRKDGRPCTALAVSEGLCVGHAPQAQEARRRGGRASARSARLGRLVPPRLLAVYDMLELALGGVYDGEVDPRVATAMASLAGAMVRVLTAGELEERVRRLEGRDGEGDERRAR
jgi:hypothetical protein